MRDERENKSVKTWVKMKSDKKGKKELVKKKVKVKSVTRENCQSERKICKKSKVRKLIEQKSKNVEESLRMG